MKVLVIGSGGREHAIVWKIAQSKLVDKIYCAPGNGGIRDLAECIDIAVEDIQGLLNFVKTNNIDLTVVGSEVPLSLGVVDIFKQNNLRIFGPEKKAAMLESSKVFSKDFMKKYDIPTAKYGTYDSSEVAIAEIDSYGYPVFIKSDGLAAGKGAIIAQNRDEAVKTIHEIMDDKKFGEAGCKVVMEEFLEGEEATVLAFVDGNTVVPMVSSQDYKRAYDNDMGLNTGGMGAVSPSFYYNEQFEEMTRREIINKTLHALKAENIEYKGVIYFELMLTKQGPMVIEYNSRFGDPETQVVLPRLETDLIQIIDSVIDGKLDQIQIEWKQENAVCVVLASGGYPEEYKKGYEINGLDKVNDDVIVFHAGTKEKDGKIITSGGRVLVVTALADSNENARKKVYENIEKISFQDAYFRRDIAKK